jgi:hypothetical protein
MAEPFKSATAPHSIQPTGEIDGFARVKERDDMSDSYQAIYDAVRSRIRGCDVSQVVENAARNAFDTGRLFPILQQEFCIAAGEIARPSAVYRPSLGPDGSKWCALYGEDLMNGVAGFGDTPEEAMRDFDHNWMKQKTPMAIQSSPGTTKP